MDKNVDGKIYQFLNSFINPNDDDITKFVESLATEDSSINIEELTNTIKGKSRLFGGQFDELYKLEEEFSAFSDQDTPEIDDFKHILFSAYDKNSEFVNISEDINKLSTIIEKLKAGYSEKETSNEPEEAPDVDKIIERIQDLKASRDKNLDVDEKRIETPGKDETFEIEDDILIADDEETTPSEELTTGKEKTHGEKLTPDEEIIHEEELLKSIEDDEKIPTSDIVDKISDGKNELSDILGEIIEEQDKVVKEPALGEHESGRNLVKDIIEEQSGSDIGTRIRSIKEKNEKAKKETKPVSALERVKKYFAKDLEEFEDYSPDIHGLLVTFDGLDKHEEVERYWVNEPYAFVVILNNVERKENLYFVVEPILSHFEDTFLKEIKDRLRDVLLVEDIISNENKNQVLTTKVKELVRDYAIELTPPLLEKILYYVTRDFTGFGLIDAIQKDDRIEDVSCNGHEVPVYLYHKQYTNIATNVIYTQDELDSFIIKLAQRSGKHISVAEPLIDATMPDGSRIQMTLSTHVTARGGTFTIRKFGDVPLTPIDLINWNTFSSETMAYLWLCIENNKSLIFAGGTASGKTSSLNAVSLFIPRQAKVISLEDTRELKLPHPNWIPSITRDAFTADERGAVDMYELLKAALRQRPEYLLVGEVRGKEALTLFQAMSTGHTTFSTMHADSVASAIHRLENPPISVPRSMIQALNIISIQSQTYTKGKRVRRNTKLVEIIDIDPQTRNIRTNDIFNWDSMTDTFQKVSESKAINDIMVKRAWNTQEVHKELKYRKKVLDFLSRNNITDYEAVSTIIYEYSIDPEKVLKNLKILE